MKRIVALGLASIIALSITACSGGNNNQESNDNAVKSQVSSEEQSSQSSVKDNNASTDSGQLGDYAVTIKDATFGTDYEGEKIIIINYDFTNNSDESAAAIWSLSTKAFQDGIELETAIVMDDTVYDAGIAQKEVQSGITIENCQVAYILSSSESPVEFEVTEFVSFDDNKLTKTFNIS